MSIQRERLNQIARDAGLPMSWLDTGKASAWPELERFADLVLAEANPADSGDLALLEVHDRLHIGESEAKALGS